MSDCCGIKNQGETQSKPKTLKSHCPVCHQIAFNVSMRTILQHLKEVWHYDLNGKLSKQQHYFCRTENCGVVYFTECGEAINKADVRTHIGIKEQDDDALICYCFGVSQSVAMKNKEVKEFVIKQTKESTCSCETANPSGRCCLKDFPKFK